MLGITPHLVHNIVVVQPILISQLWQANLIATVAVLHVFKIVLASTHHTDSVVRIARIREAVTSHGHKIRRLIGTVASQVRARRDVVTATTAGAAVSQSETTSTIVQILSVV